MSKKSLGRGLSSLIPGDLNDQELKKDLQNESQIESSIVDSGIIAVPLSRISKNPWQPRSTVHDESLEDLVQSIKTRGILLPLIVTETKPGRYELIAGERRYRAAEILKLKSVPVIVKSVEEQDKLELALIENIQRQNLNPVDEAKAYKKLQKDFGLTQDDIAKKVGKKRPTIANTLRFLSLPANIIDALAQGRISRGHAKIILSLRNAQEQNKFFRRLLKTGWSVSETEQKTVSVSGETRKKKLPDAEMLAWQNDLQSTLATKVRITKRGKQGKISIDFYSLEELKNIIERILKG